MVSSPLLDGLIAITLVVLVFSSIISLLVEYVNNLNFRQKRQMYLYQSIRKALNEPRGINWGSLIYLNPQVRALKSERHRYPAYISSSTFAEALMQLVRDYAVQQWLFKNPERALSFATLDATNISEYQVYVNCINELPDGNFKLLMRTFLIVPGEEKARLEGFKKNIQTWFDNYQDRVTGEYKKSIRRDLRWFGITLAVLCNVNLIFIAGEIFSNRSLRNSLVNAAQKAVQDSLYTEKNLTCSGCTVEAFEKKYQHEMSLNLKRLDSMRSFLGTSGLPIGWALPKSSRRLHVEYYNHRIAIFTRLKADTLSRIRTRYCLIQSVVNPSTESSHGFITSLLSMRRVTADSVFKAANRFKMTITPSQARYITHFYNVPVDSAAFGRCLPDGTNQSRYESCLQDCKSLDLADLEAEVKKQLDASIKADETELVLFDKIEPIDYVESVTSFPGRVGEMIATNIEDFREAVIFLLGALVMGLLASVGATSWFQLLKRLLQLRNAGTPPQKGE